MIYEIQNLYSPKIHGTFEVYDYRVCYVVYLVSCLTKHIAKQSTMGRKRTELSSLDLWKIVVLFVAAADIISSLQEKQSTSLVYIGCIMVHILFSFKNDDIDIDFITRYKFLLYCPQTWTLLELLLYKNEIESKLLKKQKIMKKKKGKITSRERSYFEDHFHPYTPKSK